MIILVRLFVAFSRITCIRCLAERLLGVGEKKSYKQLSYRRETAMQGGLVMDKSGRLELGYNVYGHNRSIFNHCDKSASKAIEFGEKSKIRAITPFKVIQKPSKLESIESPRGTSY